MINQFLVEGSTATAVWGATASSPPVSTAATSTDISSSGSISSGIGPPLLGKRIQQLLDGHSHDIVDYEKIRRKSEHGHDHNAGSRSHLLPGGPSDASHLELQIFEILLNLRRPAGRSLRQAQFFCH